MRKSARRALRRPYELLSMFLFDPLDMVNRWRGLPAYARNARRYSAVNGERTFAIRWSDLWYRSFDRFGSAGAITFHYFYQDLWASSRLYADGIRRHVDVGSRVDGFIAQLLPFCDVCYVDVRRLEAAVPRLTFVQASITSLPFRSGSVSSLSCLHVLEHVGLGRYGDTVDPAGYRAGAAELGRVLRPGGVLLFSTPVGRERVCFDAHRIFDPQTVVSIFAGLRLTEFSLIDDRGRWHQSGATFEDARRCAYGCGLFRFEKAAAP